MPKKIILTALKKVLAKFKTGKHMPNMNSTINTTGLTTVTLPTSIASANTVSITSTGNIGAGYNIGSLNANGISSNSFNITNQYNQPSAISVQSSAGKELVRLNRDGTVTWSEDATVDEAAESFGRVLQIGVELSAGITYAVKQRMRDTVFEEMISLAKEKGSLTVEDLTYLHTAAKIMDKLKGKE